MARNYESEGNNIDWINGTAAAVVSGEVVPVGGLICIALANIAIGDTGVLKTCGVFTVPKVDAAVIAVGESVLYDSSKAEFEDAAATAAAGDVTGGVTALEAKGATTGETIRVRISGAPGVVS